jgi:predicted RecB family nuclease
VSANRTSLQFSPGAAGPVLREDLSWQDGAACQYTDPEIFFIEKGGSPAPAKRVCRGCDIRVTCLQWALDTRERFGILGGMSEQQRRGILRLGLTAAEAIAEDGSRRLRNAAQEAARQDQRNERDRQQRAGARAMAAGSGTPAPQLRDEGGQFLAQVSAAKAA